MPPTFSWRSIGGLGEINLTSRHPRYPGPELLLSTRHKISDWHGASGHTTYPADSAQDLPEFSVVPFIVPQWTPKTATTVGNVVCPSEQFLSEPTPVRAFRGEQIGASDP